MVNAAAVGTAVPVVTTAAQGAALSWWWWWAPSATFKSRLPWTPYQPIITVHTPHHHSVASASPMAGSVPIAGLGQPQRSRHYVVTTTPSNPRWPTPSKGFDREQPEPGVIYSVRPFLAPATYGSILDTPSKLPMLDSLPPVARVRPPRYCARPPARSDDAELATLIQ